MSEAMENATQRRTGVGALLLWLVAEAVLVSVFIAAIWWFQTQQPSNIGLALTVIIFTAAQIALCMTPRWMKVRAGEEQPIRAPYRRYMARFMPAMMAYVVLLMAAISYWKVSEPTGVIAWFVALAPVVPILFAIRAIALLHREETDEYWSARNTYAHVWGTNATLAICAVWGFLDMFGLVPHAELWVVFPLWAVATVPGHYFAKRKLG